MTTRKEAPNRPSRFWRTLIVVNVIVTVLLALWVVLFATGTDSLLPPALDPNAETRGDGVRSSLSERERINKWLTE